jgi:cytochrome P450
MTLTDDVSHLTARRFGRTSFLGGDTVPPVVEADLPPGPRWPVILQSVALMRFRHRFHPYLHRKYCDVFTIRLIPGGRPLVMFTRPAHAKEIFAGDPEVFHATLGPSIVMAHQKPDNHPDPWRFRPDRFIGHNPPTNAWIPFGGGVRRCIGAGFSLMESVAVLREVFAAYDVSAVGGDEPKVRNITSVPRRGAPLRVTPRR